MYVDGITRFAIQGDGSPYVNGQSGVDAVINVCSGTGDATLLLSGGRTMAFSFSNLLASNSATPAWATGTVSAGFMNVRNIAYVPLGSNRADEYTFTTRFGSSVSTESVHNLGEFRNAEPVTNRNDNIPESE